MATISGTMRAVWAGEDSCCAISGGSDVALPMPRPVIAAIPGGMLR